VPGGGSTRARRAALESLVEAERAFASACAERGIKTAFLACLDSNGVVFRPQPVNGIERYSQLGDTEDRLAWEPRYADVSATGDLGYTTGPWTLFDKGGDPRSFGEYVSVWRRKPGGGWKVVIDLGITHPKPAETGGGAGETVFASPARASAADTTNAERDRRGLGESNRRFFREWSVGGFASAYREFASDDILVLRDGEFPVRGKRDAMPVSMREGIPSGIESMGGGLAAAGDIGYTYGVLGWGATPAGGERRASYVWVWKRGADGEWKIVVDAMVPWEPKPNPPNE
jgi:ketosteroid isomerase-like protein